MMAPPAMLYSHGWPRSTRDLGVECIGEGVEHGRLGLAEALHGAVVDDVGIEDELASVAKRVAAPTVVAAFSPRARLPP
jgi:hypothetical protein